MALLDVRSPETLWLDSRLSHPARLVWLTLAFLGPSRHGQVVAFSRLSEHPVRKALAQLTAIGWATARASIYQAAVALPSDKRVRIPADLIRSNLSEQARLLYGLLQLTPGCKNGATGQFQYPALAGMATSHINTVKRAIRELSGSGWLTASREHQLDPFRFQLLRPATAPLQTAATLAKRSLRDAKHTGQEIMRQWLTLLVADDNPDDDATPEWLVNPATHGQLEFDRFYPAHNVAFEYNGPQHYGPTEKFPSQAEADAQRMRDLIKAGLCLYKDVPLVIVHKQDLSLAGMQAKVGRLLPLRKLHGHRRLIDFLERVSRQHRGREA